MKRFLWTITLALPLFLSTCQTKSNSVTIYVDGQVITRSTESRLPADILASAEITLEADDRVIYLGSSIPPGVVIDGSGAFTLTVRRAVTLTLVVSGDTRSIRTSAASVGQALTEAGYVLTKADEVDPPSESPLIDGMTVIFQPASPLIITADGQTVQARSSAETVGQALVEVGFPLMGLDYAVPPEESPLPGDGNIRVVRVVESVVLVQKNLPYITVSEGSADLEIDQQQVTQPGAAGLAVSRVRLRSEDGNETVRTTEDETVIRPPEDRIISYGTQVVMHTAVVDGITLTYWRALQFYATSYHPSELGNDITASGQRVRIGLVAIDTHYIPFGTQMFVPGYGPAEAADTGGFSGRWIDLGYPDADYIPWHQWVTVYFLWPPPVSIPYTIPAPCTWKGLCPSP